MWLGQEIQALPRSVVLIKRNPLRRVSFWFFADFRHRCRFLLTRALSVGSPSASLRHRVPLREASTRPPRREGLCRSLRKESRFAARCLMACAAADPDLRAGVFDSASCLGEDGRPSWPAPCGPLRPDALDARHRGEGDGYCRRTVRWFGMFKRPHGSPSTRPPAMNLFLAPTDRRGCGGFSPRRPSVSADAAPPGPSRTGVPRHPGAAP